MKEDVEHYIKRHAESNGYGYDENVIMIDVADIASEVGISTSDVLDVVASNPIHDSWLEEEFGQNMYRGPYHIKYVHGDVLVYCTPGSSEDRDYGAIEHARIAVSR